jgi:hypothetical protein
MGELMDDPAPDVRRVAVAGACVALSTYWPLFSATAAAALCQRAVSLALDASSGPVRAAALEGLQMLLAEHLAHPVMKRALDLMWRGGLTINGADAVSVALLPELRVLLLDSSRIVREQMAGFLAAVCRVRAIKFADIVPLPLLLERLSCDPSEDVRAQLAVCLAPTYLPDSKPLDDQRQRALALCTEVCCAHCVVFPE